MRGEPQYIFQGEITLPLRETLGIAHFAIGKTTTENQVKAKLDKYRALFAQGRQAAFVARKGGAGIGIRLAIR